MLKNNILKFCKRVFSYLKSLFIKSWELLLRLAFFFKSWWAFILGFVALVVFLYYPLGGFMIHRIDTDIDYDVRPDKSSQSAVVEMAAAVINREVNVHLWTPNLPFFFPSYFLDNMPNFQLGVLEALQSSISALSQKISPDNTPQSQHDSLRLAAELLSYPGTVWMFEPNNSLKPAPSSSRQYRKARRELLAFNEQLSNGTALYYRSPQDLAFVLGKMINSLKKSEQNLEVQVREFSSAFWDTKADDVFYHAQGKAYGFLLIMKAFSLDYREVIVNLGLYEKWTHLLKALENAALIRPAFVRNAEVDSSFAPNHLEYLRLQILRAVLAASEIKVLLL